MLCSSCSTFSFFFSPSVCLRNAYFAFASVCHFIYQLHMAFQQQNTPYGRQTEAHILMPEFIFPPTFICCCRGISYVLQWDADDVLDVYHTGRLHFRSVRKWQTLEPSEMVVTLPPFHSDVFANIEHRLEPPLLWWPGMLLEPFYMFPFLFRCMPELNKYLA